MLINLSNHPFDKWDEKQMNAARQAYGEVKDLPFPAVDPRAGTGEIKDLAVKYLHEIMGYFHGNNRSGSPDAVHVQGEFTFVFNLVTLLKKEGITCVASTAMRNVRETGHGEKIIKFDFVQFREY